LLDGLLERLKQIVGREKARSEVSLDLKGVLPVHSLDPALYLNGVAMREESHRAGINGWNADRTGFALSDVAYLLELGEVLWVCQKDP